MVKICLAELNRLSQYIYTMQNAMTIIRNFLKYPDDKNKFLLHNLSEGPKKCSTWDRQTINKVFRIICHQKVHNYRSFKRFDEDMVSSSLWSDRKKYLTKNIVSFAAN